MKHLLTTLVFLFLSFFSFSQTFNLTATKLEVCDVNEIPQFVNDTCLLSVKITSDTLILDNLKSSSKRVYEFDRLVERTNESIAWTSKNNSETGVILFFLQKKNDNTYILYLFFDNCTYRYYCN